MLSKKNLDPINNHSSETPFVSKGQRFLGELIAGLFGILVSGPVLSILFTVVMGLLLLAACMAIVICGVPVAATLDLISEPYIVPTDSYIRPITPDVTAVAAQPLPDNVVTVAEVDKQTYLRLSQDRRILLTWDGAEKTGLLWIDLATGETHGVLPDVSIGDVVWLTDDLSLVSRADFNQHWVVSAAQPRSLETHFAADVEAEGVQEWLVQGSHAFRYGTYVIIIGPDILIKDLSPDKDTSFMQNVLIIQVPFTGLGQEILAWKPEQDYPAPDGAHVAVLQSESGSLTIYDSFRRVNAQTRANDYYPSPRTSCTILPFGWRYDSAGVLYRVCCEVYYRPLYSPILMLPIAEGGSE